MTTRCCLSLAISIALCARAGADPQLAGEARVHFDKAMAAYDAKRFDEALEELRAAYAIDPRPDLVYAEAQALRMAGRCREAIETYRRFLALSPPATEAAKAERHIARCGDSLQVESAIERDVPAASSEAPPWYSDRLGIALTAAGVAGIGVGIGLAVAAAHARDAAMSATDYPTFLHAADRDAGQTLGSRIGFAAGGVLLAVGVVRFVF